MILEECIKEIKKAKDNNKLIVFVGAGVSKNSNLPDWSGLIEEFAEEIGYKFKLNADGKKIIDSRTV